MTKMTRSAPRLRNIILMGMKHSGKTSLGISLADRLHARFEDLDEITERLFDPERSATCREIYRLRGKEAFGELEARAAEELARMMAGEHIVAALGGGTIENAAAMDALKHSGVKVYLKDKPSVLYERIMQGGLPAFLNAEEPRASFQSLYERRTALFEQRADLVVTIDGADLEEAFAKLYECVEAR